VLGLGVSVWGRG